MKNSMFVRYLGAVILLLLPVCLMAQDPTPEKVGLFSKIGNWLQGGIISLAVAFIGGIFAKKGYTQIIKMIAHKTAAVTKEVGEFFTDFSTFSETLDNAIKDDGTIEQNSVKEVLAAGKEVIAEGKDVLISIKPKPAQ